MFLKEHCINLQQKYYHISNYQKNLSSRLFLKNLIYEEKKTL